jgi:RhtB (resistance to homoserine/threonine) family protein
MEFLPELLTIATIHLLAVMSPGPDFAMVSRNSLIYSRKIGLFTSIGLGLGVMVHVIYSLVGIGLIISQSIILFNIVKFIGAAYLIYIGYRSLTSKSKEISTEEETYNKENNIKPLNAVWVGFVTNITNPKVTIFFLSLFTQLVNPETPVFIQAIYGIEMSIMTILWFTFVAFVLTIPLIKEKFSLYQSKIEKAFGALLIALGIKVALLK